MSNDFYHYFTIQKQIRQTRSGLYVVAFEPKIYKDGRLLGNPDYMILTPDKLIIGEVKSELYEEKGKRQLRKYKKLLSGFSNIETELILYRGDKK
jgi:hypothetical protein